MTNRIAEVIFTGEEMAVICVATSLLTSMVMGDIEGFQEGLAVMKEEQARIADALSTLMPKLSLANDTLPFIKASGEVS